MYVILEITLFIRRRCRQEYMQLENCREWHYTNLVENNSIIDGATTRNQEAKLLVLPPLRIFHVKGGRKNGWRKTAQASFYFHQGNKVCLNHNNDFYIFKSTITSVAAGVAWMWNAQTSTREIPPWSPWTPAPPFPTYRKCASSSGLWQEPSFPVRAAQRPHLGPDNLQG